MEKKAKKRHSNEDPEARLSDPLVDEPSNEREEAHFKSRLSHRIEPEKKP
jgi:hypothetical protein